MVKLKGYVLDSYALLAFLEGETGGELVKGLLAAAHLKARTPIAYADCFAAALAIFQEAILVTGDPEFNKIKSAELKIEWLSEI